MDYYKIGFLIVDYWSDEEITDEEMVHLEQVELKILELLRTVKRSEDTNRGNQVSTSSAATEDESEIDEKKGQESKKSQVDGEEQKFDEELFRRNIEILMELGYSEYEAKHTLEFVDNEVYIAMQLYLKGNICLVKKMTQKQIL